MKDKRNTWKHVGVRATTFCMSIIVALCCHAQRDSGVATERKPFLFPDVPDTLTLDGRKTIAYYKPHLDEDPEFPGGMEQLMRFLSKNITYPQTCFSAEGRNITKVLIDKEGRVRQAETIQSVWDILDEELIRVIFLMPTFKPAIIDREPVNSWYYLPVNFRDSTL